MSATSSTSYTSISAQPSQLQPPPAFPTETHPRLSIATPTRLLLGSVSSGVIGFTLGAMQGGQMAQLRFRAEHAHKMPDTTTGWYFYHKSKNYHAMQGGIREGFRMGAKTGFWSFVALSLESTVDRYRQSSDMFSTIVATLTVAGGFSLWRECLSFLFPHPLTGLFPLFYSPPRASFPVLSRSGWWATCTIVRLEGWCQLFIAMWGKQANQGRRSAAPFQIDFRSLRLDVLQNMDCCLA